MKPSKKQTLAFIEQDGKLLLGMKKRGFGAGRYNGFGGKVGYGKNSVPEETVEEALKKEMLEESGIKIKKVEKRAIITFDLPSIDHFLEVHVFKITEYEGIPKETEEMRPEWFDKNGLPFDSMWPDDKYWFPHFLKGEMFTAKFKFDKNDEVLKHEIKLVDEL